MAVWANRQYLLPALAVALVLPFALVAVITSVVASMPLSPDELLMAYIEEAERSPVEGLRYEQLVAVDAVRFRQDFSRVTPETIRETIQFFTHCETVTNPKTGEEEAKCQAQPLEVVMANLQLAESDQAFVRQFVAFFSGGHGHHGEFVFNPTGPYTWPVEGQYRITSTYGLRTDPMTGEEAFHTGVDVGAPQGTPVRAAATGTVTFEGWDGNYGLKVRLDNGGFYTDYAHLAVTLVEKGQVVAAGEVIGLVGNTGKSTGPHLHFEWWTDGMPVDPLRYFGG